MKRISFKIGIIASFVCLFLMGCGDSDSKKRKLDNENLTQDERAKLEECIKNNPKFLETAKSKKALKKLNSENWYNILSEKPEFVASFKEISSFDIFTDEDLYKLYIIAPNLRNEIFNLNRIDVDIATNIEKIVAKFRSYFKEDRMYYSRQNELSGMELAIIFEMFPDYALSKLNENSMKAFDKSVFVDFFSRCNKNVFDDILSKYAYIIPWKKFTLSDWISIIANQESGYDFFKKNVDIKTVSGSIIKNAFIQNPKDLTYVFEKYNIWKEINKKQWVEFFAKNNNGGFKSSKEFAELITGHKINSFQDLELANAEMKNMSEGQWLDALSRLANSNVAKSQEDMLLDSLKGKKKTDAETKKEEQKSFDIFEIAKKCGVFELFDRDDWVKAASGEYRNKIIEEFFRLNKEKPSQEWIEEFVQLENVKILNLWEKLSANHWKKLLSNAEEKLKESHRDKNILEESKKAFNELFSKMDECKAFDKFDDLKFLLNYAFKYSLAKDCAKKYVKKELWLDYFSENVNDEEICQYFKDEILSLNNTDIIKIVNADAKNDLINTRRKFKSKAEIKQYNEKYELLPILKIYDVNKFSFDEFLTILEKCHAAISEYKNIENLTKLQCITLYEKCKDSSFIKARITHSTNFIKNTILEQKIWLDIKRFINFENIPENSKMDLLRYLSNEMNKTTRYSYDYNRMLDIYCDIYSNSSFENIEGINNNLKADLIAVCAKAGNKMPLNSDTAKKLLLNKEFLDILPKNTVGNEGVNLEELENIVKTFKYYERLYSQIDVNSFEEIIEIYNYYLAAKDGSAIAYWKIGNFFDRFPPKYWNKKGTELEFYKEFCQKFYKKAKELGYNSDN